MTIHPHVRPLRNERPAIVAMPSLRLLRALALKRRLEDTGADDDIPLCVGLDGALVRGRMTPEAGLALLRSRPRAFLRLLPLVCRPTVFRARLRDHIRRDPALLPFRRETLRLLQAERARGRELVLIGTADSAIMRAVAGHLGIFRESLGGDGGRDLTAAEMARLLCIAFGPGGFDYVGMQRRDMPIWATARQAVLLSPEAEVLRHPQWRSQTAKLVVTGPRPRLAWLAAMRPSHWPLNLLLFAPLLAHGVFTPERLVLAYCGACACGLVGAGGDMAGGILAPPRRNAMPGRLGLGSTLSLAAFLAALGFMAALSLSMAFAAWLALCPLLAAAHVLWLRRGAAVSVTAAALALHRLLAGGIVIGIKPFAWQVALAVPLFLAFAAWRHHAAMRSVSPGPVRHRLRLAGIVAGCVSVGVLVFYARWGDPARSLGNPAFAGALCPLLLYWLSAAWLSQARIWRWARRGFAFRPVTRCAAGAATALAVLATFVTSG